MTKFCPRCERTLEIGKFYTAKSRKHGIRANCKDCDRVLGSARINDLREKVHDKLGHICGWCGFEDKRALQIDHVFGGGNQEHAKIRNKETFLRKVIDDTAGLYQILCANCNWIKRSMRMEIAHPHVFTPEQQAKILQSNFGKPVSAATKRRLSEAGKGKPAWNIGVPAWNRGVPRPEELKERLSDIAKEVAAARTPGRRKEIAAKRENSMTKEQKIDRSRKSAETKKKRRETNPVPPKEKVYKETKVDSFGFEVPYKWSLDQRKALSGRLSARYAGYSEERKAEIVAKRKATIAANRRLKLAA